MPLVVYLAWRFLVDGKAQSTLIVVGVAVGVSVQVFVSSLIAGLQKDLVAQTVDVQPHVIIERASDEPRSVRPREEGTLVVTRAARSSQRLRSIDGWSRIVDELERTPGVRAASPMISGPGIAVHGESTASVVVQAVIAERWKAIVPMDEKLVSGAFELNVQDIAIGAELAEKIGVSLGDKLRLETAGGRGDLFAVRAIFDLGNNEANARTAFVALRSGQMMFDLPGGATHVDASVIDVFDAERIAGSVRASTGLDVVSWMESNAQLLSALKAQSSSTAMIEVFVLLAVAMGITSVLVVSVVERRGQIGILRAIGTTRRNVVGVFLLQGAAMGLAGAIAGSALGALFAWTFQLATAAPDGTLRTIEYTPSLFLKALGIASMTGVLAAVLPARHASRLDPAVAIRHG
jgi:lipoprotein-releasing system permease protein